MSLEGHARRLRRAKNQCDGPPPDPWREAVRELDREQRGALAMVAFALDLAGTKDKPMVRPTARPAPPEETARPNPPVRPRARGNERIWSTTVRPGPHDLLSWEEAMRVPWIDGIAGDKS